MTISRGDRDCIGQAYDGHRCKSIDGGAVSELAVKIEPPTLHRTATDDGA
jgi:hypothetical protein